jgi:hypothetical protein
MIIREAKAHLTAIRDLKRLVEVVRCVMKLAHPTAESRPGAEPKANTVPVPIVAEHPLLR